MKVLRFGLLVLFISCVNIQLVLAGSDREFAITNVRLFDGIQMHQQATVVVKGDRIESVYLGSSPVLPEGMEEIAGNGRTLFPGLIDAHSHVWQGPLNNIALQDSLIFGVTTVLGMAHMNPPLANSLQALRGKPEYSHYADYYSAIISPTTPGGHGTEYGIEYPFPTITSPDEAAKFVADRVAEGSDYLKITMERGAPLRPFTWTPPATVKALIEAAHQNGLIAVGHITDPEDVIFAIESGIDGLAHVWKPGVGGGARPDIAALAKLKGTFFVPTMTVFEHAFDTGGAASLLADPYLGPRLSDAGRKNLQAEYTAEQKKIILQRHPSGTGIGSFNALKDAVRSLNDAGVTILVGTDPPNLGTWHGVSMHREMQLLVEIGMSPLEVMHAATAATAKAFRLNDRGRIAPGLRADMVMVEGDPTKNILDTRRLVAIWKGGKRLKAPR